MKIKRCQTCGAIVSLRNRSGLCRSCARKKKWSDPEFKERCGRAIASALARPDVRARRSRSITIAMNRPETNALLHRPKSEEQKIKCRFAQRRPELRALHSRLSSGERNFFYGKPGTNLGKFGPAHPMYGKHFKIANPIKGQAHPLHGKKLPLEHRIKLSTSHYGKCRGAKNWRWQGGQKSDPYDYTFTDLIKNLVRERDDFKCRLCDKPEGKRHHHAHHIFYNKRDSDLSKLITLCVPCHRLVHRQKKIWPPILTAKLTA